MGTIFVDMYVCMEGVRSIDQHIVATDHAHAQKLLYNATQLNPNLLWARTAEVGPNNLEHGFARKYPFGTVHFLMACLESLAHEIPTKEIREHHGVTPFDVLLRADDAANTTSVAYKDNALTWWDYLIELGGDTTEKLAAYAYSPDRDFRQIIQIKEKIENNFRTFLPKVNNISAGGGFGRHLFEKSKGTIDDSIQKLVEFICSAGPFDVPLMVPDRLFAFLLEGKSVTTYDKTAITEALNDEYIFSYAFTNVNGPAASTGLSCSFGTYPQPR